MNNNNSIFALVIFLSGLIVASSIFVYRNDFINKFKKEETPIVQDISKITPISEQDRIFGNPNADVIIIVYSDFECPFCKESNSIMRILMERFGKDGKVAWIYRHAPLQGTDSNSMKMSAMAECVGKIYGDPMFWNFINRIYDQIPISLNQAGLDQIFNQLELNKNDINVCVNGEEMIPKIERDLADVKYLYSIDKEFGTPYNIIISKFEEPFTISGTIPYFILIEMIDEYSI